MKLFLIDMERCLSISCLQLVSESCTKKLWRVCFVFLFSKSVFRGFGSVMHITSLFSRLDHYIMPFEMHVVCNWFKSKAETWGFRMMVFRVQVSPWQELGNTIIQEKSTQFFFMWLMDAIVECCDLEIFYKIKFWFTRTVYLLYTFLSRNCASFIQFYL